MAQADFKACGMLNGTCLSHAFEALGMKISLHDQFDFNCSLGLAHPNKTLSDGAEANLDAQGLDVNEACDQPHGAEGGQKAADGSKEPTASFEEESGDAVDDPMVVDAHLLLAQTYHMSHHSCLGKY